MIKYNALDHNFITYTLQYESCRGWGGGCTFFSKGKISRRRLEFICEKFCVLLALRLSQSLGHVGTLDIESDKSNKQEFLFAIKRKFMVVYTKDFHFCVTRPLL